MFSSVDSLLTKKERFFEWLEGAPWSTFINVGLESADGATLKRLGKPLTAPEVDAGFARMIDINDRFTNLEVTANFVLLSEDERRGDDAVIELMERHPPELTSRGACYLSPLMEGTHRPRALRRELLRRIYRFQRASPLQMCLYLIQRL